MKLRRLAALASLPLVITLQSQQTLAAGCKFACNSDPLRGVFRVQYRPLH